MSKQIIAIFSLIFIVSILHSSTYNIPNAASSVYAEDIDLDGDVDIVVGHDVAWEQTNPSLSILENNGFGEFTLIDTSFSFCGYQDNIFLDKVNNDEYPDIISFMMDYSTGVIDRYVRIFYNNHGVFDSFEDFSLNSDKTFHDFDYGDLDGDGDTDIVLISNNSYLWGEIYNDGTGQYINPKYYDLEFPPGAIACGDLNGDGLDDLAIGNGARFEVYLRNGASFNRVVIETTIGISGLRICDIDNDGANEIVVDDYGLGRITIFKMDEYNDFYQSSVTQVLRFLRHTFAADINNDDYLDIIFNSDVGESEVKYTHVLYNDSGISFPYYMSYQTYFGSSTFTENIESFVADLDNNGLKDIITVNSSYNSDNNLNILFQDSLGNFVAESQTSIDNSEALIQSYELEQNYPNPFNNETNIEYQIQAISEVEINVYNTKGQFVQSLISEKQGKGKHSVNFVADKLNSGVYYYRLKIDGIVKDTRRMLYLK